MDETEKNTIWAAGIVVAMLLLFGALEANCSMIPFELEKSPENITLTSPEPLDSRTPMAYSSVVSRARGNGNGWGHGGNGWGHGGNGWGHGGNGWGHGGNGWGHGGNTGTPEPGTFVLLMAGLIGLAIAGRK